MKRVSDISLSLIGIIIFLPVIFIFSLLIWLQDFGNPLYVSKRIGKNFKEFNLIKLRSMILNADKSGVESTSNNDQRITRIGSLVRKYKLDELMQLYNVLLGDMSLVGPRPNVKTETNLYTKEEKKLLNVMPGITDFASIVFSDEGNILKDKADPDLAYNQLIRPGKGKLGIFYINNRTFFIDILIILLTVLAIFSRKTSLNLLTKLLVKMNSPKDLVDLACRKKKLVPMPPLGSNKIVLKRLD